jgi:hypothetical protein
MHLLQKNRRCTQGLRQTPSVGGYMRGQIAHMVAQIQGLPGGQRDPALTDRQKSFNA